MMRLWKVLFLIVVLWKCVAGEVFLQAQEPGHVRPAGLRCEYAENPVGVDSSRPRLFWKIEAEESGQKQTAYQILVASTGDLLAQDKGDLWDSGRVTSEESIQIPYGGIPLRSSQQVFWKVRLWDRDGRVSAWEPQSSRKGASTASWTMGVLAPGDWQAKWITSSQPLEAGLPLFRKVFRVEKPVRRAVVHVSGVGHYNLSLDGRKVGDRFLDPAWSVYEKTVYYSTYELPTLSRGEEHVFSVMLGKGFYNTVGDRRTHGVEVRRRLKLLLQAHLYFEDGTEQILGTDGSWKTQSGPITHSAILGGEDFDARKCPSGWDRVGFDDSAWSPAAEAEGPGGVLTASYSPPLTKGGEPESFAPVALDEPEPGVFVYDFGQNSAAVPLLSVRGAAGQQLKLTPAEQRQGMAPRRNDGKGKVDPAGVGKPNFWQYTLRGGELEAWTPQFNYSGFQYLQLEGAVPAGKPNPSHLPVVEKLESVPVSSCGSRVGELKMEGGSDLFMQIDRIVDWAVRSNMSHVLTDCPHREKLGWLEVSYLMFPSIAGRYDVARFYSKIVRDCQDSQKPDGQIPTVAPAYPAFEGGFAYTPEWGAASGQNWWFIYQWYGDRAILQTAYPTMKGFVEYMRQTATDLVPKPGLGDWYDYGHGKPVGASQFTPPELTAMATFYRCARIVADTAGVLGKPEEVRQYEALCGQIAEKFNALYFDGKGEYKNLGSPQTANSMALVLGLVPAGKEAAVLERIVADLRQRGNQQTAGDIGFWYLLQALARNGRSDLIYDLVSRTDLGSYGFIVQNGWTSMPEAWDANTGASMNHCMLGHIQEWFQEWVVGIQPDPAAPGFKRVIVRPQWEGNLRRAEGAYDSIRGKIRVAWQREPEGTARLELTVPTGTTATVHVPVREGQGLKMQRWESGKPVEPPEVFDFSSKDDQGSESGVRFLRREAREAIFEVPAGRWGFVCSPRLAQE